jgi:hypothetical protein
LLKLYFRSLPEPLIPLRLYDKFLALGDEGTPGSPENLQKLKNMMATLPHTHAALLRFMCTWLKGFFSNFLPVVVFS